MKANKKLIKLMLILSFSVMLISCSFMKDIKDEKIDYGAVERKALDQAGTESVIKVKIPKGSFEIKDFGRIQTDRKVNVFFNKTRIDQILIQIAKVLDINIICEGEADLQASADKGLKKEISINFKGSLKDFLEIVSKASGYFITYENNAIIVEKNKTLNILIPNHPDLLKEVKSNLESLGAKDAAYDNLTSTVSFKVDFQGLARAREYFQQLIDNASLITMRVVLLNVKLTSDEAYGIDWTRLTAGFRTKKVTASDTTGTNTTSTTTTTAANTNTATTTTNLSDRVNAVFSTVGMNLLVDTAHFTFSGFFGMIEQYGKLSILQNVFIETLSGKEGKLEVLTETPYVSQVGVTAVATQSTVTQPTAQTDKARSGVAIEILPYYSKKTASLGLKLKVGVYGVTRFLNLSAGNLGVLTQPETTKKAIETFLRMKPGQVAIIGGLVYERDDGSARGLPGDTYLTKYASKSKEREQLVVVVKPVIIEFEPEN